jgi:hypothetical protein
MSFECFIDLAVFYEEFWFPHELILGTSYNSQNGIMTQEFPPLEIKLWAKA